MQPHWLRLYQSGQLRLCYSKKQKTKNNSKSQYSRQKCFISCSYSMSMRDWQRLWLHCLPLGHSLAHHPLSRTLQILIKAERMFWRVLGAFKYLCQRMSRVTYQDSLPKSSLMALPRHKETRKYNLICLEGRELEVFGDQSSWLPHWTSLVPQTRQTVSCLRTFMGALLLLPCSLANFCFFWMLA